VFNSCSTLITWDVYKKLRPAASEQRLVWVGRVSTVVLVALGLLWIPLMRLISGQIYQYLQSVQAYISPPIAAVFLVGILWRRVNARGAMAALLGGAALGVARLVAELNKASLSGWMLSFASINFLHFAVLLFVTCTVILVVVSLTAPTPSSAQLAGLTFATTPPRSDDAETGGARRTDVMVSGLVVLGVAALWWYFS
jgi:SSS family solute:Na+ symporter